MSFKDFKSTPDNYIIIRVKVVQVKRSRFGIKEKFLCGTEITPETNVDASEIYNKIDDILNECKVSITWDTLDKKLDVVDVSKKEVAPS